MRFFDSQEEVIDIQLTRHGKQLLANGQLKPVYYAFFDNDIIYDASYTNREEEQNSAEGRIRNNTPRLKGQGMFASPDRASPLGDNYRKRIVDLHFGPPMGQSTLDSEYVPSWSVDYLYGELTGSTTVLTGSGGSRLTSSIPQLDSIVNLTSYITRVKDDGDFEKNYIPIELEEIASIQGLDEYASLGTLPEEEAGGGPTEYFEGQAIDGTITQVKPDFLLFEIAEANVDFMKENFDIEVFEIRTEKNDAGHNISTTRPLEFFSSTDPREEVGPNHVEYYFDLNMDESIPTEYFCASPVVAEKRKDMLIDDPYPKNCPEYADPKNLYVRDLDDVEEPC